jgi:hypothetical protein
MRNEPAWPGLLKRREHLRGSRRGLCGVLVLDPAPEHENVHVIFPSLSSHRPVADRQCYDGPERRIVTDG